MDSREFWLSRLSSGYQRVASGIFRRWMDWMSVNGGEFSDFTPDEFVEYQREAGGVSRYEILDLVQRYVSEASGWRLSYKKSVYSVLRSFFLHNRVELPRDKSFILRSDKPPCRGHLLVKEFKRMLASCNRTYRAIFLCMFQGAMGLKEFMFWNQEGWGDLKAQLDRRRPPPLRVNLRGRKKNRNAKPYHTFIGGDAVKAIRDYLPERPDAEVIFVSQNGTPPSEWAIRMYWLRHLERLGLITRKDTRGMGDAKYGIRYGKNPHELRDLFRTRWQKSGRAPQVAEFLMGHTIDPLGYNKAMNDEHYTRGEYRKAEPWLNIMSEDPEHLHIEDVYEREERLRRELDEMKASLKAIQEAIDLGVTIKNPEK